ncbi:MFS transporter [Streptomyces sp. NBC_01565]|uniref:MFS transporter n=1 Tax=unclassified Streptomyces TaxID=2593676 RepID=UPI00224FAAAF|nr:MFS transporter [Streptomyces sp. NBC_01565]MCX4539306.1 MFS transporter [Streptomyces sp. NBC_01565]
MLTATLKDQAAMFRERRFATFFTGHAVSSLGDAPVPVAFALAAYQVSDSAAGLTWVLLSLWGTRFLLVATGGRLADQYDRVKVMIGADLLRLLAQGTLAVIVVSPLPLHTWHLCLSAAVYGAGTALYNPAQIGLTPELVPEDKLQWANSLLSLLADVSFLLGPVLAGVLMSTAGFSWVLWLDVASFAVNLGCLIRLTRLYTPARHRVAPRTEGEPGTLPAESDAGAADANTDTRFRAGFAIMARYPWFSFGMALWFVVSLSIGLAAVAGPVIAVESLGGTGAWSLLATCLAAGSLVGSLAVMTMKQHPWKAASVVVTIGVVLQLAALTLRDELPTAVVGAAFALASLTIAACGIVWDTTYQSEIPERFLSRLGSVDSFVNAAGVPVGMLLGGLFADHYDTVFTVVGALLVLLSIPAVRLAGQARKATP